MGFTTTQLQLTVIFWKFPTPPRGEENLTHTHSSILSKIGTLGWKVAVASRCWGLGLHLGTGNGHQRGCQGPREARSSRAGGCCQVRSSEKCGYRARRSPHNPLQPRACFLSPYLGKGPNSTRFLQTGVSEDLTGFKMAEPSSSPAAPLKRHVKH